MPPQGVGEGGVVRTTVRTGACDGGPGGGARGDTSHCSAAVPLPPRAPAAAAAGEVAPLQPNTKRARRGRWCLLPAFKTRPPAHLHPPAPLPLPLSQPLPWTSVLALLLSNARTWKAVRMYCVRTSGFSCFESIALYT